MTRCNFFLPVIRLMPTDVSSRRGASPIAVEPQVFDLLVHPVQNRDRIVRKDDRLAPVRGDPRQPQQRRAPDAMNMAWTVIFPSTMFRTLDFKPTHQLVER